MQDEVIPILGVKDVQVAITWYSRLGFAYDWEERFEAHFPAFVSLHRGDARIYLSDRIQDAAPGALVYLRLPDVEAIATEFGARVEDTSQAREIQLRDPDGNRLWIGTPKRRPALPAPAVPSAVATTTAVPRSSEVSGLLRPEDVAHVKFHPTRFKEGYDQDQVDDFLDVVQAGLERRWAEVEGRAIPQGRRLVPEDVIQQRFSATRFTIGYNQDEVDDFLDQVVVTLRGLDVRLGMTRPHG